MEIARYAVILKKYIGLIVLVMAIAGVSAFFATPRVQTPVYEASVKVLFNGMNKQHEINEFTIKTNMKLVHTYEEVIRHSGMLATLAAAHPQWGVTEEQLNAKLSTQQSPNTPIMKIIIQDPSYAKAVEMVNELAILLQSDLSQYLPYGSVVLLGKANPSSSAAPVTTSRMLVTLVSVLVSGLVTCAFAFLRSALNQTFQNEQEIREELGLPVLASVPRATRKDLRRPNSSASETRVGEIPYATAKQ